jgi:hypothetical protein
VINRLLLDPEAHRLPRKTNNANAYPSILESPATFDRLQQLEGAFVVRASRGIEAQVGKATLLSRIEYQGKLNAYKTKMKVSLDNLKESFQLAALDEKTAKAPVEGSSDWPGLTSQEIMA